VTVATSSGSNTSLRASEPITRLPDEKVKALKEKTKLSLPSFGVNATPETYALSQICPGRWARKPPEALAGAASVRKLYGGNGKRQVPNYEWFRECRASGRDANDLEPRWWPPGVQSVAVHRAKELGQQPDDSPQGLPQSVVNGMPSSRTSGALWSRLSCLIINIR